jgi:hypothetical protein
MKGLSSHFNSTGSSFYPNSNGNSNNLNNNTCSSGNLAQYKVYKSFLQK